MTESKHGRQMRAEKAQGDLAEEACTLPPETGILIVVAREF
jgi:hypothetical protein